jgi:putative SOS response-associated peptidase YedK
MCGRYSVTSNPDTVAFQFEANFASGYLFEPIYNGAPTNLLPVITSDKPSIIQQFRFGFIAPWNPKLPVFNTVSETVTEKKMFSEAIKSKRCLILANGFYEWSPLDDSAKPKKQPYYIFLKDQPIFAMAGIWNSYTDKETGEEIKCFSILTTTPNELMETIKHHRCPVILTKEQRTTWLKSDLPMEEVLKLGSSIYPANQMNAYPVNKVTGNSELCIEPIGETIY